MLPVNTLRDLIRANQFFASSSLVVSIGAAGFATSTEGILHFKVLCIVSAQGVTFIIFLQAVRIYSHLEILINTETFGDGVPVTDELCYAFMKKATSFGAAGQKGLMITFPLLLWLFGPLALALATLALLATFRALDWDDVGQRTVTRNRSSSRQEGTTSLVDAADPALGASSVQEELPT